jgi:hypothetical protein
VGPSLRPARSVYREAKAGSPREDKPGPVDSLRRGRSGALTLGVADSFEKEPGIVVVRTLDDRKQILDERFVSGSSRDREILRLIREGNYDRADIRNRVAITWLLSFERKAQRWRKNRVLVLGDG